MACWTSIALTLHISVFLHSRIRTPRLWFISFSQFTTKLSHRNHRTIVWNTEEDDRQRNTGWDTQGNMIVMLAQCFCHSSVGQSLYAHTVCNAHVCFTYFACFKIRGSGWCKYFGMFINLFSKLPLRCKNVRNGEKWSHYNCTFECLRIVRSFCPQCFKWFSRFCFRSNNVNRFVGGLW